MNTNTLFSTYNNLLLGTNSFVTFKLLLQETNKYEALALDSV